MRGQLFIMLKEPRVGRVKTRLGRDIGPLAAAWWFRHQVRLLLREMDDPRWNLRLAVAPDRAVGARWWPGHLPRVAQGGGDLGARMARVMRGAGPGRVCVIGGDVPGLRRSHIAKAFGALGSSEAVFGPARDGGYWLAGLRHGNHAPSGFLEGVRWSSRYALADSMASLGGARCRLVDMLEDVDTGADLSRVAAGRKG